MSSTSWDTIFPGLVIDTSSGYRGGGPGRISVLEFFSNDDWYYQLFVKYADPRTNSLLLLSSPEPMLLAVLVYLTFLAVGPRCMANRNPFNLRFALLAYNTTLVLVSAYTFSEFVVTTTSLRYNYGCQPVDWNYSTDALSMRLVNAHWLFFVSKIIELSDTVFFVLRKKNNQVTFLHVYHHATMVINWWMATKYIPVGQSFFAAMLNSFIHVVMYLYYALAALGPGIHKYLWWKQYVTVLQLVQFVAVIIHTSYNRYVRTDCDYPNLFNFIVFYYSWSMIVLFSHFYYMTYVKRRRLVATSPASAAEKVGSVEANGKVKPD